jgi:hypothetical protein
MQEDANTLRSESSIAPLLDAFSDILILARDNTDWGAEFQGIPTEAMIQFFLAHLSEPDHKFALSSLFEESVAAVLQEEMQFQDTITSYLEGESANVYEMTGHASAHDNNCSIKFEQKSLFFMADKLAVEANRKRTAFLDREHRQQGLVKQWRQLTRKVGGSRQISNILFYSHNLLGTNIVSFTFPRLFITREELGPFPVRLTSHNSNGSWMLPRIS